MKLLCYVFKASWKRKLQNKFKNLHCPDRIKSSGLEPPLKKLKNDSTSDSIPLNASALAEYTKHKTKLKQIYESKKGVISGMCDLLSETFGMYIIVYIFRVMFI